MNRDRCAAVGIWVVGLGLILAPALINHNQKKPYTVVTTVCPAPGGCPVTLSAPASPEETERELLAVWRGSLFTPEFEVPPPKNHPPLHILVGHQIYRVAYYPKASFVLLGGWASNDTNTHQIMLCPDDTGKNSDGETPQDVLLHELEHIALAKAGGHCDICDKYEPGADEGAIKPMAPELRKILHDNPGLTRWLTR